MSSSWLQPEVMSPWGFKDLPSRISWATQTDEQMTLRENVSHKIKCSRKN